MKSSCAQLVLVILSLVSPICATLGSWQDDVNRSISHPRRDGVILEDIVSSDVRWSEIFPGHGVPVLDARISNRLLSNEENLEAELLDAFENGKNWVAAHTVLVSLHNGLTSSHFNYSSSRKGPDLIIDYDGLSVHVIRGTDGPAFIERTIYPNENQQRRQLLEMWKDRLSGVDLSLSKPETIRECSVYSIRSAFQKHSAVKSSSVELKEREELLASFKFVQAGWGHMVPTSELLSFPVGGRPEELRKILVAFSIVETSRIDDEVARAHMLLASALFPNSVHTNGSARTKRGLECVSVYVDRIPVVVDTRAKSWTVDFKAVPFEEIRHFWKCVSQYVLSVQ